MNPPDDIRHLIAASRRILYREGLDSQIGGHVSVRVHGDDAFWVTPYQYFDETLPEHVSKIGFDLDVREAGTIASSPGINFHAAVYEARPEINSIIHTHSRNVSTLTTTGEPFGMYYTYAGLFLDDIAFFEDDGVHTPDEEGPLIVKALGSKRALLMSHHGAVNVADTLEHCTVEAVLLELCAGYQLAAMAVGGKPLPDPIAATYRDAYLRHGFREQMWDANLRRLPPF